MLSLQWAPTSAQSHSANRSQTVLTKAIIQNSFLFLAHNRAHLTQRNLHAALRGPRCGLLMTWLTSRPFLTPQFLTWSVSRDWHTQHSEAMESPSCPTIADTGSSMSSEGRVGLWSDKPKPQRDKKRWWKKHSTCTTKTKDKARSKMLMGS